MIQLTPTYVSGLTDGTGGALLNYPNSVYVSGNYAYVASTNSNALEIINVSDPTHPAHAGSLTLLASPHSVYVVGNYAYVVSASNALEIINVSDPAHPAHAGSLTNGTGGALLSVPYSVYVAGNYAYVVSIGSNALEVVKLW